MHTYIHTYIHTLQGQLQSIEAMIDRRADVQAYIHTHVHTYIHTLQGQLQSIEAMIDRRADVQAYSKDRLTPLHLAATNGHSWCTKALLVAGVCVCIYVCMHTHTYRRN